MSSTTYDQQQELTDSPPVYVVGAQRDLEDLCQAMREAGFDCTMVEAPALDARITARRPSLIVIDADDDAAVHAAGLVRQAPGAAGLAMVLVGSRDDLEPRALHLDAAAFARPLDLDRVVATAREALHARLGSPAGAQPVDDDLGLPRDMPPPSISSREPEPLEPMGWQSSQPPSSSNPPASIWPAAGLPAGFDASFAGPTSLGPDLQQLLDAAEQRALQESTSSDVPTPEQEVNAILPPDVLAALDEPLGDEMQAGSNLHTPAAGLALQSNAPATGELRLQNELDDANDVQPVEPSTASGQASSLTPGAPSEAVEADRRTDLPPPDLAAMKELVPEPASLVSPSRADFDVSSAGPRTTHDPSAALSAFSASAISVVPASYSQPASWSAQAGWPQTARAEENRPVAPVVLPAPEPPPSVVQPDSVRKPARVLPAIPEVLSEGFDGFRALALCVASRLSGAVAWQDGEALRTVIFREGDFTNCASSSPQESLVAYLVSRGDLPREVGGTLLPRVPAFGRHAAAALIASGFLGQDQLWPVLRAHAEWLLWQVAQQRRGRCTIEHEAPPRLRAEPAVFGGATGAEVLLEVARRSFDREQAIARLGGLGARLGLGPRQALLGECALGEAERELIERLPGATIREALEAMTGNELPAVLVALTEVGALEVLPSTHADSQSSVAGGAADLLDAEAVRQRVRARLAIIDEGNYFEVLGIARHATSYEVKRAYLEMRRALNPSRLLTAATADLADELELILRVVDEAYEVLRDEARRERYRRAIEALPPA